MPGRENQTIKSTIDWLLSGARSAFISQAVLAELCERLTAIGIPLSHVDVFVRTLHPDREGRRFEWTLGREITISLVPFDALAAEPFAENSPQANIPPAHLRLHEPGFPLDSPVIRKFLTAGATDILATPLVSTSGEVHSAIWATDRPGGFATCDIADLTSVVAPLARVAEVRALRQTAINLLDTYVGNHAGGRILAGQIRRGHVESINAAIWLSDMRGFTTLSDRIAPRAMIDLLNRYFDCQEPAILRYGGEILKFMGDGLLAMFPIHGDSDPAQVCSGALAAAREARASVASLRVPLDGSETQQIRFGLALHLGQVLYGNIGGKNRLDFTCIGPAVNLAARVEKLASSLGRVILTSTEFAEKCPADLVPLGEFPLRGVAAPQKIFGLPDETSPSPDLTIRLAD